jgi:replicative DNA helicase
VDHSARIEEGGLTMTQILAYPERELALVLAAVKEATVYDTAVAAGLLQEHLTQPPIAAIWRITVELRDAGEIPRSAVMLEKLRALRMEEPGRALLQRVPGIPVLTEAEALDDTQKIVAAAKARETSKTFLDAVAELRGSSDPQAALAVIRDRAFGVAMEHDRARAKRSTSEILMDVFGRMRDPLLRARRIVGIATTIESLDAKTGGFRQGKVVIVGARPGAGKTAFVTSVLADQAERHDSSTNPMPPLLFFSLEMDDDELVTRVMCAMVRIDYEAMMHGAMPPEHQLRRLVWAADVIAAAPLEIDDETPRTVEQIAAEIFRWHRRRFRKSKVTIGYVVIDYLTRIKRSPGIKTLQDHVMHCMAILADVAKRTGLAIVVLSQLTRGHVKEGRMPEMDDLKGGGDIEENAFHVILLHPLGKTEDAAAGRAWRGSVAAMVEKNRAGPTGMIMLKFDGAMYKFRAWSNEHDGSLDDVLGSISTARGGAPKPKYTPTQKKLSIPVAHLRPAEPDEG